MACGSTEFEARFYESQPKRIKIVCAQGHTMTSISGGHWVSRDFFLDDDRYSNMLPASWIASVGVSENHLVFLTRSSIGVAILFTPRRGYAFPLIAR